MNHSKAPLLSLAESKEKLTTIPEWAINQPDGEASCLEKTFTFTSYLSGIKFVQEIALKAEEADHHPDLLVQWRKVTVNLSTHDSEGLTEKDFALAQVIEEIYKQIK
jgi:4a-hydroxytetrahydrobiopterin dehydratase